MRYNAVTPEASRGFGFPGADDLGNMFQLKPDFEDYFCGARGLEVSRRLHPGMQTFAGRATPQLRPRFLTRPLPPPGPS